jgi:hypothetical protein
VVPLPFRWASFTRENRTPTDTAGKDRPVEVAKALQEGPVFAPAPFASILAHPLQRNPSYVLLPGRLTPRESTRAPPASW